MRARSVRGFPEVFAGHDPMATLYAISPLAPAAEIADTLHAALLTTGLAFGVSVLPDDCGAWARILGSDSPAVGSWRGRISRPAALQRAVANVPCAQSAKPLQGTSG
ncbi:hypothetical protein ACH4VM_30225 [Streptomyces sp. NPDC020792]|uniref:hypothetical protein n=1 Tax=Streptomyces sp. NPDC020792 TaxID=3365089 RepID=UPI00378AD6F4